MYDELVKRLRDDEAWKNCDFDFIYGWMHEAADAIEELSKPRWIPVSEQKPKTDDIHILEEKGIPPTEYEAKPKPQTNADKLRAMSDEELAEWLGQYGERNVACPNFGACDCRATCIQCWLDWLRQEASDG